MIYRIENLSFKHKNSKELFNNINFEIEKGKIYTILGENGCGKTTLFNCMLGIIKNYKGNILLNNQNNKEISEKKRASLVSYVPQGTNCTFDYSVYEFILMGCASRIPLFSSPSIKEKEQVNEAIKLLDIEYLKDKKYNELSGGEKQLALIARAIVNKPQIILFDEPTSHLDLSNQIKILKIVKELNKQGYTIIITTHDPNQAFLLNGETILFDSTGNIMKGGTDQILTENNLQKIYGKGLKIMYLEEYNKNIVIYPSI